MVTHHKIPIRATLLNHIQPRHLLRLHQRPLHGITICSNEKRSTLANSSIKLLISHKSNLYNKSFILTDNPPLNAQLQPYSLILFSDAQYAYLLEQLIEQHLPVRFDMQLASDYLQMSERHLRRSLLLEGISFQQIRQTVLERKAKQMLKNNLSIGDISQALGFREVREFRRAFKRWTGQAPSVYKNGTE